MPIGRPESSRSPASSHTTKTSNHESIYDYLDALETQSERQLQSAGGSGSHSISGHSSAGSARSSDHRPPLSHDFAWESESETRPRSLAAGGSPAPSFRSQDASSHEYYLGIKEKVATMTIELSVRPLLARIPLWMEVDISIRY